MPQSQPNLAQAKNPKSDMATTINKLLHYNKDISENIHALT